ncbi:MAG TPA: GGDEF domain-containing phosphodiesterase, partial [Burkholderiaceae bacterium]|nr:GGDEF domain-containing phosphodiesterase [Burkholderiaceae bacterium]
MAPPSRRVEPRALLSVLAEVQPCALLLVMLNRSDRLAALGGSIESTEVMREIVRRLESVLRPNDLYSLPSHEELWISLGGRQGVAVAELAARRVREMLARPLPPSCTKPGGEKVWLHPAVGVVCQGEEGGLGSDELLSLADRACRSASTSMERIGIASIDAGHPVVGVEQRVSDIRAAIKANDLDVFFQPQVLISDRRCIGAEALIRWPSHLRGKVSPVEIVSVAESDGLMLPLTMFVLNNALRHLAAWRERGFDMAVSVNISAATLGDASFPMLIRQALDTWGIAAANLVLELTEQQIVTDEARALRFMQAIREMDVELALD